MRPANERTEITSQPSGCGDHAGAWPDAISSADAGGGFDAASFAGAIVATGFFAVLSVGTAFFARIALYHRSTRFRDDILPVLNVENPGEVFVMSTANA